MFDIEKSISGWRRQMLAAGIKTPVPLEELEIHLRDEIERRTKPGSDEEETFNAAAKEIGQAHELRAEFAKIRKLELKEFMKNPRMLSNLALAIVVIATVWLVFVAVMIGRESLFPKDGLISLRVSDGATVLVRHGIPTLLSNGAIYSGGDYHAALIPAMAVPFAILFAFAIVGCRSLLRKQTA